MFDPAIAIAIAAHYADYYNDLHSKCCTRGRNASSPYTTLPSFRSVICYFRRQEEMARVALKHAIGHELGLVTKLGLSRQIPLYGECTCGHCHLVECRCRCVDCTTPLSSSDLSVVQPYAALLRKIGCLVQDFSLLVNTLETRLCAKDPPKHQFASMDAMVACTSWPTAVVNALLNDFAGEVAFRCSPERLQPLLQTRLGYLATHPNINN